ncbi:regulatorof gluconeogenesis [Rhodotorula toruloides]|uniref:GID complex catalytic subunit 2 n=1 Tax=Rhodotorula toruloides TaxID=5286 RepID=A0A511KA40_RHOTO|nr:regulatorof gluconeogenesis [Rhodotorula toruloides]
MAHLDPLPHELAQLAEKQSLAFSHDLATVDELIARLSRAKGRLDPHSSPDEDNSTPESSVADEMLQLSSYVRTTANRDADKAHKEWSSAVSRLGKTVDKKFSGPPAPLFPPAPVPPTPSPPSFSPFSSFPHLVSSSTAPPTTPSTPSDPTPFTSPSAQSALHSTIAAHLARSGSFATLDTFMRESETPRPPELSSEVVQSLKELREVVEEVRAGKVQHALEWVERAQAEEEEREAGGVLGESGGLEELEYRLRKEEFVRLVLAGEAEALAKREAAMVEEPAHAGEAAMDTDEAAPCTTALNRRKSSVLSTTSSLSLVRQHPSTLPGPAPPSHVQRALSYGGLHLRRFIASSSHPARKSEICALFTSTMFLPLSRLASTPYAPIYAPYLLPPPAVPSPTESLLALFTSLFLARLPHKLPRDDPLKVVTDVGGSGALAKIMKVRAVMKEKKTEWSAVEIPLPLSYRFHSIFSCPVSKEQSTPQNPPMLLPCGHVIARESLVRLARGTPTLKCPYCPVVSHFNSCVRVYF